MPYGPIHGSSRPKRIPCVIRACMTSGPIHGPLRLTKLQTGITCISYGSHIFHVVRSWIVYRLVILRRSYRQYFPCNSPCISLSFCDTSTKHIQTIIIVDVAHVHMIPTCTLHVLSVLSWVVLASNNFFFFAIACSALSWVVLGINCIFFSLG